MPVKRLLPEVPVVPGDFWVHRATGMLVEIVSVDLSGGAMVDDAGRDDNLSDPRAVGASSFQSVLWQRIERTPLIEP